MQRSDGIWRDVLVRARRVERNGEPFTVATVQDVAAQKQTETALRRREQYRAVTLNSIGEAVNATDAAGRVTQMNVETARVVLASEPGESVRITVSDEGRGLTRLRLSKTQAERAQAERAQAEKAEAERTEAEKAESDCSASKSGWR